MPPLLYRLAVLGVVSLSLSGCGLIPPHPPTTPPSHSGAKSVPQWITVHRKTHSVTIQLIAGYKNGGFNFDGTENGAMTFTVPKGEKVTVKFLNQSTINHSAAVVANGKSTTPLFAGASTPTNTLKKGLAPTTKDAFTFTASKTGNFRIACLVPGHEGSGMWVHFNVTSTGSPSVF